MGNRTAAPCSACMTSWSCAHVHMQNIDNLPYLLVHVVLCCAVLQLSGARRLRWWEVWTPWELGMWRSPSLCCGTMVTCGLQRRSFPQSKSGVQRSQAECQGQPGGVSQQQQWGGPIDDAGHNWVRQRGQKSSSTAWACRTE
jgi:hypothetical protein